METCPIDAALGVPEVWRSAGQQVSILHRTVDTSPAVLSSAVLPEVTRVHLTPWVRTGREMPRVAWIRRVRAWAASLPATPESVEEPQVTSSPYNLHLNPSNGS